MLGSLLLAFATPTDFQYEIARAKDAIGDYGSFIFRDEQVHVREGANGSTIETFCAIVQYRDAETERVRENPFYWVLRVRPARGFISDYERGSWEGAGETNNDEFKKLCIETSIANDSILLRSKNHVSSGSLYDPTTDQNDDLSGDWIVGSWVYADSCATSRDEYFRSDGYYDGTEGKGKWIVNNRTVILELTSRRVFDEESQEYEDKYLTKPVRQEFEFSRTGFDSGTVGNEYKLIRC